MTFVTYNLSAKIEQNLNRIDILKNRILTLPINPQKKTRLVWEYDLEKVYWSLVLSGNSVGKERMAKLLFSSNRHLIKEEREIVSYMATLNYIYQNWTVVDKEITLSTLKDLYNLAIKPTHPTYGPSLKKTSKQLEDILKYTATGRENPVIQAGIVHIHILGLAPFKVGNGRIARLSTYLFLYKNGYSIDRLFCLDEYFRRDLVTFRRSLDAVSKTKNITLWLEYFTEGMVVQLSQSLKNLQNQKAKTPLKASYWKLNSRQREVLDVLTDPDKSITNKQIQEKFKVSQITASRDLQKLTNLKLIFRHGQSRSTYYTGAIV